MIGNSFGTLFVVTTCGESHGEALLAIVDGCPAGLELSAADLQEEVERRKTGKSRFTSQRKEPDQVKIVSGVFEGKTTGTPIGLIIENQDSRSRDYDNIKELFRPGHADYTYFKKYGTRDYRGGGRSSARETVMRVAAGAIAKKYLRDKLGVNIYGFVNAIGEIKSESFDKDCIEQNPFFFPDASKVEQLENYLTQIRRDGDSIGAEVKVIAEKMPIGLGEPVFSRLDAEIAKAMLSIPATKAVGIGDGFDVVQARGSEHRDQMDESGFLSNHAGGTLGGISNGEDLVVSVAFKPTSSIVTKGQTVDTKNQPQEVVTKGRHDPCVGIRAVPITEAMLAMVVMDFYLQQKARGHNEPNL